MANRDKKNFSKTLNLPRTEFQMKGNLSRRELDMLKYWQDIDLYRELLLERKECEKFILHDGPPYANGNSHIGHALNRILKDIINRSKLLDNYSVPFIVGWDCHGLPIELEVEKRLAQKNKSSIGKEFRDLCRQYAQSQVEIQKREIQRLGILADWDNPYLTMNYRYEADIMRALAKIMEKGYFKQGFKPVYWCLNCQSSLAEAEVEYRDHLSQAIDIKFLVCDSQKIFVAFNLENFAKNLSVFVAVWTTTPWTIPANQAVALNGAHYYLLVKTFTEQGEEDYLIINRALAGESLKRYKISKYFIVGECCGEKLEGLMVNHPLYQKEVKIILADYVTEDSGTGAVHTAPAHGADDFIISKKYNLAIDNPLGKDGYFKSNIELVGGLSINRANEVVIEKLRENGKLLAINDFMHSYPHCWRHKTPLIFTSTPQCFIDFENSDLSQRVQDAIYKVKWLNKNSREKMINMIQNRPDWCISRQRMWGVPIPLIIHKTTKKLHSNNIDLIYKIADRVEKEGIEAWYNLELRELIDKESSQYQKGEDVIDVWFDAGISHFAVLKREIDLKFPATLYLEGIDQYRGWFNSSLTTAVALNNSSSFEQVLAHGFVTDKDGRKMSKSLKNAISPEEIINKLGADILRLWVSSSNYSAGEINLSHEILIRVSESYRRIRNTARFFLANLYDFEPITDLLEKEKLLALDRWAISVANRLQKELQKDYRTYSFWKIYQKLYNFCNRSMGNFYLDIIKDRLYITNKKSRERLSAQTAFYHLINSFVRWIAPILPFTAEEIYQNIPGKRKSSIFFTRWYKNLPEIDDKEIMNHEFFQFIQDLRNQVNKKIEELRESGELKSSLQAEVTLYCNQEIYSKLTILKRELHFLLIVSKVEIKKIDNNILADKIEGLKIEINRSIWPKCIRCWMHSETVDEIDSLCHRCRLTISDANYVEKREIT